MVTGAMTGAGGGGGPKNHISTWALLWPIVTPACVWMAILTTALLTLLTTDCYLKSFAVQEEFKVKF